MTSRQLRLLRAASASAIATLLAAVSHTVAGGTAPHALLVIALAALLTPTAALLIGLRPRLTRVAATVAASQAVFHIVFLMLGAPTGAGGRGGHVHHLDLSLLEPVAAVASPDVTMLVSHAAAAVFTTLLIWHGERLLRTVAGWVQAMLRRALAPVRAQHDPPATLRSTLRPVLDAGFTVVTSRRGPPALLRG